MMKREYAAAAVLAILISLCVWNMRKIDNLTAEIGIALCKSQTASEQLNFKSSRKYMDEGLTLWLESEKYTDVFFSQAQIDETTQAFYQLKDALSQEDVTSCAVSFDALGHKLDELRNAEHPSVSSIF